jgi:hypothetical protein
MKQVTQGVTALPPTDETHEETNVNLRGVFLYGLAFLIAMAVVVLAMTVLQYAVVGAPARLAQPPSYTTAPNVQLPPQPRFEENPGANLEAIRAREDSLLNSYGWVDQNAGTVRVPINRAMELLVERGFPVRPEDANNTFDDADNVQPSYSSSGRQMERIDP